MTLRALIGTILISSVGHAEIVRDNLVALYEKAESVQISVENVKSQLEKRNRAGACYYAAAMVENINNYDNFSEHLVRRSHNYSAFEPTAREINIIINYSPDTYSMKPRASDVFAGSVESFCGLGSAETANISITAFLREVFALEKRIASVRSFLFKVGSGQVP